MARKKSEFLKGFGKAWEVFRVIVNAVLDLGGSDEDLSRLLKDKDRVRRIGEIVIERPQTDQHTAASVASDYFTPVPDADVPERHQPTLAKYRQLATDHGVPATTPVCYLVRGGLTLKHHAPKAGPCRENFRYLQDWNFPDEPTSDCLVFWMPRILDGSTSITKDQQTKFLSDLRTRLELSDQHLAGFGKVALVAGLILAHHKATGERIPLDQHWVRTDSSADGYRLGLGPFDDAGLHCDDWYSDEDAHVSLGVFALGVEPACR